MPEAISPLPPSPVVYGLVRTTPALPSGERQRAGVCAAGADVVIEEEEQGEAAAQRLWRLLQRLRPGDVLAIHSLGVLGQPNEMLPLVRMLLDRDVGVVVTAEGLTLGSHTCLGRFLEILESEAERTAQAMRPLGGSRNPLSPYQLEYARRLHRQGESLRAISLLFQVPPKDVWRLLEPAQSRSGAPSGKN